METSLEHENAVHLRPVPAKKQIALKASKAMTIAAGFRCKDGVVLCADSEITLGTGKTYQSKILPLSDALGCYLTYCGSADFAKELAGDLKRELAGISANVPLPRIKNAYKQLFEQSCNPDNESTWTSILVTLREQVNGNDRANLYAGRGRHFAPEAGYATLGIGQDQSEAIFNPLYASDMTINDAIYMAIYALRLVKAFVPGCGGETTYIEVMDDGDLIPWGPLFRPRVEEVEQDFGFLQRVFRPILLDFANLEMGTKAFDGVFQAMAQLLRDYRRKRVKEFQAEQKRLEGAN